MVINIKTFGARFQSNCYFIENDNKEAVAIDIGGNPDLCLEYIQENNISLKKILLTHGHFDHTMGVARVAEETGAEVFIHAEDEKMLLSSRENLADYMSNCEFAPVKNYTLISDNDEIEFSGEKIKVIHTPGHTKGSVCYLLNDAMFSGDTLFRASAGRTDFPGGSSEEIRKSLQRLKKLGENTDYKVYPGHDNTTVLSHEIKYNPFMRQEKYTDDDNT